MGDALPAMTELLQPNPLRIAAGLALPIVSQLRVEGADVEALLGQLGLSEERLLLPEARIPHETWIELLEAGQAVTGDPHFGLHAGAQLAPGLLHLLGHLAGSEKTAGEAYAVAARYLRVLHEGITIALARDGDSVSCRLVTVEALHLAPIATEFLLAKWVSYGRKIIGDVNIELTEVRFAHPARTEIDEYWRVFRSRVVFGAERNELIFPAWNLELPTANADPVLAAVLAEKIERLLAQFSDHPSLSSQVREWLITQFQGGNPRIEALAGHLHMSERTLRRRLGKEGTTFKRILDEVRRELAIGYVQERLLSTGEIAFLLRYSEPSAFQRAFKRWTKLTPSEYRGRPR
jgi:AraC-like DNA-binding protein